ncbi:MAG: helix-hairpin-helix domain-containing protein [Bacteroidetes bacterium]|nr:helix-hairpin-helix domain-containing protein [Bacteroidota bacterium]
MEKIKTYNIFFVFKVLSFAFLCCFFSTKVFSQEPIETNKEEIEQKIENLTENTEAELDYSDLVEGIEYLKKHPINLNNTNTEELSQLFFLNSVQISNLLLHIKKNGKLLSLYELQSVDGFSLEVIYSILPYVFVANDVNNRHFNFKELFQYGNSELFLRYQRVLQDQLGYSSITDSALAASPNSRYLGTPEKLFLKYRFKYYDNISFGITGEKDAGEQFFKGAQKNGFDFYSVHLFLKNFGVVKALAVGDYQLQFGQGLTLWSGMGFGKSSDAIGIRKSGQGIKPFTSTDENLFMRGIATTIGIKNFNVSAFYSKHKIDANISAYDSLNNEAMMISSVQETGLHSTPNEVADRDAIGISLYGAHLGYTNKKLNIGATAYKTVFDTELKRDVQLYNQFEFQGKENLNFGIDYSYIIRNFNIFGEVSRSENGGMAYLNGIMMSLDARLSVSVLHRKYEKDYQSIYSSGFAEGSSIANEEGLYLGFVAKPFRAWTLTAYCDNFASAWMKFRTDAPSKGIDYLVQLNYKPTKKIEMYFKFKQETKQLNSSENSYISFLDNTLKQTYRFNLVFPLSEAFSFKSRVEFSSYKVGDGPTYHGYLAYENISYKLMKSPITISLMYAIFDTDNYDTRIYAFENDVLYGYSSPAYYYKGSRINCVLKYRLSRSIDVWLKYGQTIYSNKNVVSSGLTEINGNTKSEIKAQIRFRF